MTIEPQKKELEQLVEKLKGSPAYIEDDERCFEILLTLKLIEPCSRCGGSGWVNIQGLVESDSDYCPDCFRGFQLKENRLEHKCLRSAVKRYFDLAVKREQIILKIFDSTTLRALDDKDLYYEVPESVLDEAKAALEKGDG